MSQDPSERRWPALVPELLVRNLDHSLSFWCDLCGFAIAYARPDEGFGCLLLGEAYVMLEEAGRGRNWVTGAMEPPFGRGLHFQIMVKSTAPIIEKLNSAHWPLFMASEDKWYSTGDHETGVRQFLVQDPDGYLLRFAEPLGNRPVPREPG